MVVITHTLFKQLRLNDREQFFRYYRMSPESFDYLLQLGEPDIRKNKTRFCDHISPEVRSALNLRYLASAESQQSLSCSYRVEGITVSKIIRETCKVIWKVLMPKYMKLPTTEEEWKSIAKDYEEIWNLVHCIVSIDGKHIAVEFPKRSVSLYFNYKGFYSLVLLTICAANYCFTVW